MDAPHISGFEILDTLPRGGMSIVYKARQVSLDRVVALKTLPPSLAAASADLDKFLFEARITANLKHSNIVQVYDFGKSADGIYYFVMEFISGYSVADWIRRKGQISELNSLLTAQSVAVALGYAWEKAHVIHCDIKPDNVIIDSDGTIKVADLGLARSVGSVVDLAKLETGVVVGTPNYISPEQSRGDIELDCRTDIYALGAMLYHCMTGKMPFEGLPPLQVMDLQLTERIEDPQDLNPNISSEAAWLIEKMMIKDRDLRQPDWNAVLKDIGRVLQGQMILGDLPPVDASTIRRSPQRSTHSRLKLRVHAPPPPPAAAPPSAAARPDSGRFQEVERRFEQKQKSRKGLRLELWIAAVIAVAALVPAAFLAKHAFSRARQRAQASAAEAVQAGTTQLVGGAQAAGAVVSEENAQGMFDFAAKWAKEHPAQIEEALRNFEKVAADTRGTKYSLMATDEIKRLRETKRQAVDAVLSGLREKTSTLIVQNQFAAAAELYEQYQGPWGQETETMRQQKASELRARDLAYKEEQRQAIAAAGSEWQRLLDNVTSRLIEGDADGALQQVKQAPDGALKSIKGVELATLAGMLAEATQIDKKILQSFNVQKDQELSLDLVKGVEKMTVRDVTDDSIKAEKIIVVGTGQVSQERVIKVADLALKEKLQRLGPSGQPETALMQGLLALREGDAAAAANYFAGAGPLLAETLTSKLNQKQADNAEKTAKATLARLMRNAQIDVPEELPDVQTCLAAIHKKALAQKEQSMLTKNVNSYRARYAGTDTARAYAPVLTLLANVPIGAVQPQPRPEPTPSTPAPDKDALRSQLLERNPGMDDYEVNFRMDAGGRISRVELISQALKDIRPLSGLTDLREAVCSAINNRYEWKDTPKLAPLDDISPLRGLPLRDLDLCHTRVKDISPLAGMPLARLNLSHTKVGDLIYLKGMPLVELNVGHTPVREIRVLQGMPLERLAIDNTEITDFAPLAGMRLSYLDVSGTKIRDLISLRAMPLKYLDIGNTEIQDISQLRGMPLEQLQLSRLRLRDLSALTGMSLTQLDIAGTEVKSLAPLKGMPLESLRASGIKIFDLSPLIGSTIKYLYLDETDIKDFSQLRGIPVRHLMLRGTKIKDLTPLQGLELETLDISATEVKDLAPLKGMPLRTLYIRQTGIKDLSPIQNCPLENIRLDIQPFGGGSNWSIWAILRRIPTLKTVNDQPVYQQHGERHNRR